LVTLSRVTVAATMRKIPFWRYLAVTRKTLFAALICALLVFSLLGCGNTDKLQSIQLTAALINGVAPTGQSGFVALQGNGGTIQLLATGSFTNGKTKDLTGVVTYTVVVDPNYNQDAFGDTLIPPCVPGTCPVPGSGPPYTNGTVEYGPTGLITAVDPAACTFEDVAPLVGGVAQTPSWVVVGDYVVTATYNGITSQPFYVPVASSEGNQYYDGQENNPNALCDSSGSS
jgi:hypothetical protein